MISEIRIQNFKSISDLTLKPGRVTVLIGENGSGKSNILEAIAFAAGAASDKLDNNYLFDRGIRIPEDDWFTTAFPQGELFDSSDKTIRIEAKGGAEGPAFDCLVDASVRADDQSFAGWHVRTPVPRLEVEAVLTDPAFADAWKTSAAEASPELSQAEWDAMNRKLGATMLVWKRKKEERRELAARLALSDFIIYAPENTILRTPPSESAILPVGFRGEGWFKLLQSFAAANLPPEYVSRLAELKERLGLFGWFEDFLPPDESGVAQAKLQIRDRWLAPERAIFDQRSANEGFLYVLFYFSVLMSWRTPPFFAIDNIDNALNPRLCAALMRHVADLARKYGKQVICTTHNPAILDGLNINDDTERLFTVARDSDGHTVVNRVRPPKPLPGNPPTKLSTAFLAGNIGGLPDHF